MRFFDKTGCNLGDRGIALILITASLAFFIILFLVFLGVSYIYSIRGQLQNAADAGALAGAALLEPGKGPGEQDAARETAADFALENFAAGEPVEVKFDGSDTIGDRTGDNDLTVGFWSVIDETYTPADDPSFAGNPVNAVEVLARRTKNRLDGRFPLFFGDVHGFFNMTLASRAIAFRPPTPSSPLAFCVDSCTAFGADPTTGILPAAVEMNFKEQHLVIIDEDTGEPVPVPERGIAWTEYSPLKSTNFGPDSSIARFIRGEEFLLNVCGIFITTTNASSAQIMNVFEDEFNEEAIPAPPPTGSRAGWEVIAPIVEEACPPGRQPEEPYRVVEYAFVNIKQVLNEPKRPGIIIDKILCIPCFIPGPGGGEIPNPNLFPLLGQNPVLVK